MTAPPDTVRLALRRLPPVNTLLEMEPARSLLRLHPRPRLVAAIRAQLDEARSHLLRDGADDAPPFPADAFFRAVERALSAQTLTRLQRVLNGTGIVLHTNMGRAPLAPAAVDAVRDVSLGYSNLELDLADGRRGGRGGQTEALLCRLTGAEAALVVNNCAAAVLLALSALAGGGEVVISRGELVEIGGAFRIPDVIAQSGARLAEVGTTNKTRLSDYEQALTPETRALLKVHQSNYRIIGFHSEVGLPELVALARAHALPLLHDLGSGALVDLSRFGLPREPTVGDAVRAGIDVVACSGDKLLGGPQCGLLVGRAEAIARMARHPLFRALRADKMTLAALEATLRLYEDEAGLPESVPVLALLSQPPAALLRRARRLRAALSKLPGLGVAIKPGLSFSGGGTLPEVGLPSQHVHVRPAAVTAERLSELLRRHQPPVMGMIAEGAFVLDVRTLRDGEIAEVVQAFRDKLRLDGDAGAC